MSTQNALNASDIKNVAVLRNKPGRKRLGPVKLKERIVLLLGNPDLSQREIAELSNCSLRTVERIAKEYKPARVATESLLSLYSERVLKKYPLDRRVDKLIEVADNKYNPFASLRAVERMDLLNGIDLRPAGATLTQDTRPIFQIAGNALIDCGGSKANRTSRKSIVSRETPITSNNMNNMQDSMGRGEGGAPDVDGGESEG